MARGTRACIAAAVVAVTFAATATGAQSVATGTFGGGGMPPLAAAVGGPGTMIVSVRPSADRSRVRIDATLRAACGAIAFEHFAPLSADGTWFLKGRDVQRQDAASVIGSYRMGGRLTGTQGNGYATVSLRVRTGKRVRRCKAAPSLFEVHRVRPRGAVPAPAPAMGGSLYTGLTSQSITERAYPIVVRTSPEGRTVTGVAFQYFCFSDQRRAVQNTDYLNAGTIGVTGRFRWVHAYTLKSGLTTFKVRNVIQGSFRKGAMRGTITASGVQLYRGRRVNGCRPPEPVRFTAVANPQF